MFLQLLAAHRESWAFITLQMLDAFTTQTFLSLGGAEFHPVVAWLYATYDIGAVWLYKVILAFAVTALLYWYRTHQSRIRVLNVVNTFFLVVVYHNLFTTIVLGGMI